MLLADHRGAPVDTAGDILFEDVQGVFYSNDRLRVCTYEGEEDAAKGPTCKNSRPRDLADSNAGWFINDRDAWLLSVQEVGIVSLVSFLCFLFHVGSAFFLFGYMHLFVSIAVGYAQ